MPMLHRNHRNPKIPRETRDQLVERGQAAPRRSDDDDLVLRAVERIAERTDGVPLFVEELTKSVLARLWPSGSVAERIGNAFLER